MRTALLRFGIALVVFVAMDALFIVLLGNRLYQDKLLDVLRPQAMVWAALPFYPLFALALAELAIRPAGTTIAVALRGALVGAVAYGTYGMTNLALVAGWSRVVTAVDLGWGLVVGAVTSMITTMVITRLQR
jgi:uncharacterized membrane protein